VEDAIECYQRAGNMFKMSKNWTKAGECFCEAATLHARAGSRHDAGTCYVDASNCYKKVDVESAVNCLMKSIDIYTDMGRFTMAAKHHQSIAEMYESDPNNLVGSRVRLYANYILMGHFPFRPSLFSTMSRRLITSRVKSRSVRPTSAC